MKSLNEKNVALIIPDFNYGGEEKRVIYFANNYIKYFKNVYVFAPDGTSKVFLHPDVLYINMNVRNIINIYKVSSLVKKNEIHFLQGHKRATLPYLLLIEKINKIKCFFNFDNIYLKYNWLCSLITPTHVVYLSEKVAEYYARYNNQKKNKVINMGGDFMNRVSEEIRLELKKRLGINETDVVLVSLGRLAEQKNHRLLLSALREIEHYAFVCLIVGGGPLEAELKSIVENYGLASKVKFLGHRDDVESLLNISDMLIQSSIFEGFPNVFIEACSIGLPIVATDVGSSSTLVKGNGILIQSGQVSELSLAILEVLNNYNKYKKVADMFSKSDFFLGFHKNIMLENYLKYFQEDLGI